MTKTYTYRIEKDSAVCTDLANFLYRAQKMGLMNEPDFRYDQRFCWMTFTTDPITWDRFMDVADQAC